MEKTFFLRLVSILAILLLAFSGAAIAAPETSGDLTYRAQGHAGKAFTVNNMVGSKVLNLQGENLGKIDDIVVDIDSGRILYAIMDFGGFLGIGGKSFPVPWESLAPLPSEGVFYLNVTKDRMKNAPSYDKDKMPEMASNHWGQVGEFYFPRVAGRDSRIDRPYQYGQDNNWNFPYRGSRLDQGYGISMGLLNRPDLFQKIFKVDNMQQITGEVMRVDDVVPEFCAIDFDDAAADDLVCLNTQTRLLVYDKDKKEAREIYLGPAWYVGGRGGQDLIRIGDTVTVKGSWIDSDMGNYMIATSITQGSNTYQLRDETGRPAWTSWSDENGPTMQETKKK